MPKGKSRNRERIDPRELDLVEDGLAERDSPGKSRGPKLKDSGADRGTLIEGMVVGLYPRGCHAVVDGKLVDCDLSPAVRLDDENDLAIGDRVMIRREPSRHVITEVVPRTTVLARPDPLLSHRERVVAANVDTVVHVASVVAPPLRPGLIDRYLVAIASGGASPLIAVNKIDLVPPGEREAALAPLEPYRELGVDMVPVSSQTREGIEELKQRLIGRMAVFVGHSGVGKSSIIRTMKPELTIRVGSLRARSGTGRHTTTRSTLYEMGNGTRLIDTPGIREFGLWQIESSQLRHYFPEFGAANRCHFNDCLHGEEPDCGVREGVEKGLIRPERFASYRRLLDEIREEEKGKYG
ncbi:MAG TPA: ribosome small subunit-dependent GTPase A [Thermoanaerobaculia bacterium]|nr:ribosome small subunit-dependent GTPase A [Thermoanaerobaculia bacterium]